MGKEHFKNLLGNSPNVTYKPMTKIINCQHQTWTVDKERTLVVLKKLKAEKLQAPMK